MPAPRTVVVLIALTLVLSTTAPAGAQDAPVPVSGAPEAEAAAVPVEVPERLRIRLADLHWPVTELREGKIREVWKKGDDTESYPAALGRIEASEIVWKHKIHALTSVTVLAKDDEDQPTSVRVVFALGTLDLRVHGRHPTETEARFTPADGMPVQRFRTGGNWGIGCDMLEEAASAPPPPPTPPKTAP